MDQPQCEADKLLISFRPTAEDMRKGVSQRNYIIVSFASLWSFREPDSLNHKGTGGAKVHREIVASFASLSRPTAGLRETGALINEIATDNQKLTCSSMNKPDISNKWRMIELIAVILTAIGKFIFMDILIIRLPFILVATIIWTLYIIYRSQAKPGILSYWGFRRDNFRKVVLKVLPFGTITLCVCIAIGVYRDTIILSWHIIPILLLYPVWGTIQQFLLIALTAGNLQDLKGSHIRKEFIIFVAALLFGLIHYPFTWLIIGTFILAIFYGWIYLNERNLYVLGLFHGWLGAVFYYTVLERDPFVETFGKVYGTQ